MAGPGAVCSTIGTGWSPTGAYTGVCIWHRMVVQTGSYAAALEPVCTSTRCSIGTGLYLHPLPIVLHGVGPRPKIPAAVAAGTDGTQRYWLQEQLVTLAHL